MPTIESLRAATIGQVIGPDDADYDEARTVYNAMIDRRPAAVVRCETVSDVAAVVDYARVTGAPLAVRGGAHSVPGFGTADDAVVADLKAMNAITVDPEAREARVGGGATLAELNAAAGEHGLGVPAGIIGTTGVGGLTLGGGFGYLSRKHGLSIDNLLSVEIVTADSQVRQASKDENPDLFWAVRGGGGNFGAVTEFRFQLHPVTQVLAGPMFYELADGPAVFRHFRGLIADAPRSYWGFPAFNQAPPLPFIPEDRVGEPFALVQHCWNGPEDEGQEFLQSFREVATPMAEGVGMMPYPAVNEMFNPLVPPGMQHYWKAAFVSDLSDDAIDAHFAHGPKVPSMSSTMHLYPLGGAVADVASDATAWGHRDAKYATVIAGMWPDPSENDANTAWVRDYYTAIAPYSEAGTYINFASADDQDRVKDNFGANYARLREVKRQYDPDNLFRLNQNIVP